MVPKIILKVTKKRLQSNQNPHKHSLRTILSPHRSLSNQIYQFHNKTIPKKPTMTCILSKKTSKESIGSRIIGFANVSSPNRCTTSQQWIIKQTMIANLLKMTKKLLLTKEIIKMSANTFLFIPIAKTPRRCNSLQIKPLLVKESKISLLAKKCKEVKRREIRHPGLVVIIAFTAAVQIRLMLNGKIWLVFKK